MAYSELLKGAIDLHVHASPDVVARKQGAAAVMNDAAEAGMAGVLLKEHCTSTVGRAAVLNAMQPHGPKAWPALALNPPVGGLNPVAVESFLRAGGRVVYAPTYGAAHHIGIWGAGKPPTAFPLPAGYQGLTLLDAAGDLKPELDPILELIAAADGVLATGHVSPGEGLALLRRGKALGVKRLMVTHASESVTAMPIAQQREAAALGAVIEHCFFAVTPHVPGRIDHAEIARQVREVGAHHAALSSDFGQVGNPPAVHGFGEHLEIMAGLGFSPAEIKVMTADNPRRILE